MGNCKHQWDYIRHLRKGTNKIIMYNPEYAMWVCPYCDKIKYLKIGEGVPYNE